MTVCSPIDGKERRRIVTGGSPLIELLVVVAILSILVAWLLPALRTAKESAKRALCMNNMKQVALSCFLYAEDNDHWFPPAGSAAQPAHAIPFFTRSEDFPQFVQRSSPAFQSIHRCPSADMKIIFPYTGWSSYLYLAGVSSTNTGPAYYYGWQKARCANGFLPAANLKVADRPSETPILLDCGVYPVPNPPTWTTGTTAPLMNHTTTGDRPDGINIVYADGHAAWVADPATKVEHYMVNVGGLGFPFLRW